MSCEHVAGGGSADVGEGHTHGKGFPLGAWVAEMRRRESAGELSAGQRGEIEDLPGWRWAPERG